MKITIFSSYNTPSLIIFIITLERNNKGHTYTINRMIQHAPPHVSRFFPQYNNSIDELSFLANEIYFKPRCGGAAASAEYSYPQHRTKLSAFPVCAEKSQSFGLTLPKSRCTPTFLTIKESMPIHFSLRTTIFK